MRREVAFALAVLLAVAALSVAAPRARAAEGDLRVCGPALRNADGTIQRNRDVLRAFRKLYPCPATMRATGACAGWSINHVIPLAAGGCDALHNLQWLPNRVKSCRASWCVDRWERRYYVDRAPVTVR